ncbi:hypothetical protein K0M31_001517, partial [Melipona bicolor]
MSGPSFGQRAIALTTSSCRCRYSVAQGRLTTAVFLRLGRYTAAIPFSKYQSAE